MIAATARDIEAALLRALAERGQAAAASALGISESRISRFKTAGEQGGGLHLREIADLFATLGVGVVASVGTVEFMTHEKAAALRLLAREALTP